MTDDSREGGAWIGQHPDENTEKVRESLGDDAERVAVTDNTAEDANTEDAQEAQPGGHREPETPG